MLSAYAEVDQATDLIANSAIFVAQLELSLTTVEHGLRLARTRQRAAETQGRAGQRGVRAEGHRPG